MNSTLADSASMISTSTRMVRNSDTCGKLRGRNDFYLWLFGQMHAKRLLVSLQLILLIIALFGLSTTSDPYFSSLSIPGLDDQSLFGDWGASSPASSESHSSFRVSDSITIRTEDTKPIVRTTYGALTFQSDIAMWRRNIVSCMSYFYLLSVLLTLIGLRWVECFWLHDQLTRLHWFNPGILLVGFLLSMLSFAVPLTLWSIRGVKFFVTQNCHIHNPMVVDCSSSGFIWDTVRLVGFPIVILWAVFFYLYYGCVLAFVYVWRRARSDWKGKDAAAASFSWSFRDRNTLLGLKGGSIGNAASNHKSIFGSGRNRLPAGKNGSWRSTKSTDRPTLRKFTSRGNDLNESQSSLLSSDAISMSGAQDPENQVCGSVCVDIETTATTVSAQRGFASYASPARRALDTVEEESESHEGTMGSIASRL